MNTATIRRRILDWFAEHKRDLPWRGTRDPYRIWISEIMLQQTRVAAVIPYYERFLARFPDPAALAAAPEQELLAAWAGLGYYSRARNLQKAAKKILELGGFPRDYPSIRDLPGVGDYTAAAIASIAFDLRFAALDGNVMRVLSRLTAQVADIRSAIARQTLRGFADRLVDPRRPGDFNQALMELGATVCLPRNPKCSSCPVVRQCLAHQLGKQNELPLKLGVAGAEKVAKRLLVIEKKGKVLAWQRPAGSRRLAGFWELPEPEQVPAASVGARIAGFRHTIVNTNYAIEVCRASLVRTPKGFYWIGTKNLHEVPLSTTAKKALACLSGQGARND